MARTQTTAPKTNEIYSWRGCDVIGSDGEKIGTLNEIYIDEQTGQPEWGLVSTGMLGTKSNFVPLGDASRSGDDVQVRFTKQQVKDAPGVSARDELSQSQERELWRHYGLEYSESRSEGGLSTSPGHRTGSSTSDDAMTRSEEEVRVGTTREQAGRARLRKWVETEEVDKTVPVRREKARLEREPITDANVDEATAGPEITESEHEVVLHEEEPVVEKRTVPKERVRLDKEVDTDEATVSEEVRKERIESEGDINR